jgi:hypothetical protein
VWLQLLDAIVVGCPQHARVKEWGVYLVLCMSTMSIFNVDVRVVQSLWCGACLNSQVLGVEGGLVGYPVCNV